jgi:putative endonuclease
MFIMLFYLGIWYISHCPLKFWAAPRTTNNLYYTYLLRDRLTGKYYVGYSADLKKRIAEQVAGTNRSTKYSTDWELVYYEAFLHKYAAITREQKLKHHGKALQLLKKRLEVGIKP